MGLREEKAADLASILADAGEAVVYKGQVLQALVSVPTTALELDVGGIAEAADFTVKLMRTALAFDPPVIGDRIAFRDSDFRIIRIGDHPGYPLLVLSVTMPHE
ncbi:hypothetical protein DB346_09860 [Verrucomicrobia bacterium LW23]|nr:hypothetical protein DB346_09860 [Verrucomicrobia bacterium LW23]